MQAAGSVAAPLGQNGAVGGDEDVVGDAECTVAAGETGAPVTEFVQEIGRASCRERVSIAV